MNHTTIFIILAFLALLICFIISLFLLLQERRKRKRIMLNYKLLTDCWRWDGEQDVYVLLRKGHRVTIWDLEGLIPRGKLVLFLRAGKFVLTCKPSDGADVILSAQRLEKILRDSIEVPGLEWASNRKHARRALSDWLRLNYSVEVISIDEVTEPQDWPVE